MTSRSLKSPRPTTENVSLQTDFPVLSGKIEVGFTNIELSSGEKKDVTVDSSSLDGDENQERGNWSSHLEFMLSCIGYAVGLGNLWRFPYLVFRNGGGAFLIPYAIMLFFIGLPLFFLELAWGQYSSRGAIFCWDAAPIMRGVGFGFLAVQVYTSIYYNMIMAYSIYYMFSSLQAELPWDSCDHSWNTKLCYETVGACFAQGKALNASNDCVHFSNLTDTEMSRFIRNENDTLTMFNDTTKTVLPSEEFWLYEVLKKSDSITDTGGIVWQLALCLLAAWVLVFFSLIRGVKSSGKVVYFTATFPYVVLFIFFVRGITLEGYIDGLSFFITPDWDTLKDPTVWRDAAGQIFFSLSLSQGGLITMASYNRFHNNCFRDSIIVPLINCATSLFAGVVIFSVLGFLAKELNTTVDEVADQSFGLVFVAYPEAMTRMPVSQLWSFLFFFMLLTLGLDSQFTIVETVLTAIIDYFPKQLKNKRWMVVAVICFLGFLMGLLCCTEAGFYWFDMLSEYTGSIPFLVFALFECVSLCYIYGIKRFLNDIRTMLGEKLLGNCAFWWWPLSWVILSPAILAVILLSNFILWEEPGEAAKEVRWARILSYLVLTSCFVWIVLVWVYELLKTFFSEGSLKTKLKQLGQTTEDWGPALKKFRQEAWEMHTKHGTTLGDRSFFSDVENSVNGVENTYTNQVKMEDLENDKL